ncbi:hypothetical protein HWV62_22764 [Athelia sp. TMB]|nr:hypothetical protein HWV62_22764 [Athelia sp. TMB]
MTVTLFHLPAKESKKDMAGGIKKDVALEAETGSTLASVLGKTTQVQALTPAAQTGQITRSRAAIAENRDRASLNHFAYEILDMILGDVVLHGVQELRDWSTPLKLSHVCQQWRSVLHNSPKRWLHIYIFPTKHCVHRAKFWLERSRDCPLDIVISDQSLTNTAAGKHMEDSLMLVFPSAARWRSLTLALSLANVPLMEAILAKLDSPLETLESFKMPKESRLQIRAPGSHNTTPLDAHFLNHAPRLQQLAMSLVGPSLQSKPPWAQHINDLDLGGMPLSPQTFHEILTSLPSLETLSLFGTLSKSGIYPTFTHNQLRRIKVAVEGSDYLSFLDVPALDSLLIAYDGSLFWMDQTSVDWEAYAWRGICRFIERTRTIRCLHLDDAPAWFLRALISLPEILELALKDSSDVSPIFSNEIGLTNLHTLRFQN